jgi:hypothetical protein
MPQPNLHVFVDDPEPYSIIDYIELIDWQSCAVVTKKKQKDIGEDLRSVLWILMVI